ncbi:MAG: glycerophosphodiester phosphodiesterase [candidate division NC10 bacterium]|nr:glycerophosphodiester phosphodiesterase [candidate division NC10 bacterium]
MRSRSPRPARLRVIGLSCCILGVLGSQGTGVAATPTEKTPRPLEIHAHRGGAGLAPENTLAAFRKGMEWGADALEMDLHVTRDGEVVVIHDERLDRSTDGRGNVADLTLAEVRRWDAGVKFSPAFRGERIPTLREVLELVKASGNTRIRLDLELKYAPDRPGQPEDFEERVLELLRQIGFVERVNVISFHHPSLFKMKALEPKVRTGLLAGGQQAPLDPVALVRQYQADYYSPSVRHVTAGVVAIVHRAGVPIVPWTVNEEAEMRRLIGLGIGTLAGDAIVTDYPDRLLTLLKASR